MANNSGASRGGARRIAQRIFATLLIAIGISLAWLGSELVMLRGSPYYLITGIVVIVSGGLLWRGDRRGAWLYGLMLVGTLIWALWEVGLDGWALMPRLLGPAVLGLWLLTPWGYERGGRQSRAGTGAILLGALAFCALVYFATPTNQAVAGEDGPARAVTAGAGDWLFYGNDQGGSRFSPLQQINAANVASLEPAWTFRTGPTPGKPTASEATPLKVGNSLYLCTPMNDIVAIDATTGKQIWRYAAHSDDSGAGFLTCRGVAYYSNPKAVADAPCKERVISATVDGRLLAVDARNGAPCADFGKNGQANILEGFGNIEKGYYFVTSAPQLVRGKVVFGGWINDNQHIGEPSGAIRAYDAVTGKFAWAFDVGRIDDHGMPPTGQTFTLGTPNSWAPMSADEALGLVYLPMGGAPPDWYGGQRRPFDEKFGNTVVALDAETGALRWSFQTSHHDLWDYDVASQPTLLDMPVGNGHVPALIAPTKRGQLFVLDRRTGQPIVPVTEMPVPKSYVPGERASPTQPFSAMPRFDGPKLTEQMMWGITPIDQAMCRILFREARYEGTMTPVGVDRPIISQPGTTGGMDWGGVSVDRDHDILIVNSMRMPMYAQLLSRAEADRRGIKRLSATVHGNGGGASAQEGTPYAIDMHPFMSALQIPCVQPPYAMISAIDLKTRKLLWTRPFGTARKSGPFNIPSMLPFTMGVPAFGGSVTTRGGVFFIGASMDQYLRAIDTRTGRELWKASLPAGGQATPMTYMAGNRQYVVISAGGHVGLESKIGDYVVAYALPNGAKQ
jgi:quinoprotein glucose dehydrogenase